MNNSSEWAFSSVFVATVAGDKEHAIIETTNHLQFHLKLDDENRKRLREFMRIWTKAIKDMLLVIKWHQDKDGMLIIDKLVSWNAPGLVKA